jgi:hypothetical protein
MGNPAHGYCDGGLDHVVEAWTALVSRGAEVYPHGADREGEWPRARPPLPACARPGCSERAEDDGDAGFVHVGAIGGAENTTAPCPFLSDDHGCGKIGLEILGETMKRAILFLAFVVLVGLLAAGCMTAPTPAPPNPAEVAMTMAAQKVDAEATQMRIDIQFTATAQIVEVTRNVQNTQAAAAATEQFRADAQATDQQNRRDAAATEQQNRKDAAATEQRIRDDAATQQARRDAEATSEQGRRNVIGTSTAQQAAIWNGMTQQVAPTHDIWTQQAVYVKQTKEASDAEKAKLSADQQADKNTAEWVVPLLVVVAVVVVVAIVQIRRSRVQKFENEETGEVVGLLVDGEILVQPDLMPSPVLDLSGKTVTAPEVTDKATQNEVTRRAQAIKALQAMPTQAPSTNAALMANNVFGEMRKPPVIEVIEPGRASRVILDELSDQVIEEE